MASPYEIVLGAEIDGLHPRLRAYFGEIPAGSVGRGQGTFDRAGTPRRWLWPALWLLGRAGIAFPAWEGDVAFTVENRPMVDAAGVTGVRAVRTFHFARGERRMLDAITAVTPAEPPAGVAPTAASAPGAGRGQAGDARPQLVDTLGGASRLTTRLRASVEGGALTMHSDEVAVRIGPRRVVILPALAPTVELVERFDDGVRRQHVSVVLRLPVIGRIYEYAGHFDYTVTDDRAGGTTGGRQHE
ncbi:hypothetical protein GCM10025867_17010 [Frondihabitans sucicola]|uniref:DUF4166 domain-containing protein n=1 Tax=Frondihabitans sucicola TaxID=1268041 RepID=A0ABN6Y0I7_9MICO|nr:DUF4166 domain-containing protein [Frondihabitans sucicola]BDZ49460.1 hypothetical protein GCM10025867_17010 [Frondihabitans sucicola]